ncbi:MAG: DNA-3-methyladenine glycosylase 2 family protein [Lachnospiraceae bacterium]|nr:DNA-3-methyladenine glycosylase 2 family protein [Lachnospiraceae bacterium]MDE6979933.1 DNA-3-methyladenine glycosylase 2 family protein [Lachnospiraceae bacterium]
MFSTKDDFESFTVHIEDDFDLEKIADSGQCFRVKKFADGFYRFITGNQAVYIRRERDGAYCVSCAKDAWEKVWRDYFDLSRNYRAIRKKAGDRNPFVDRALEEGTGIRVLRQNTWEMLITFIISQRKNIPAISKAVETLSKHYGKKMETRYETLYTFPTPEELRHATAEELKACGLGYRTPYVMDAAQKVSAGCLDLKAIAAYEDQELFEALQEVHGVGKKVANCICLFGYGRTSRVPVDVWIARAIQTECDGENIFEDFGEYAGIIQQYIFYYERNRN